MSLSRVVAQEHQACMEEHVELASESAFFYSRFTGEADRLLHPINIFVRLF